MSSAIPRSRQIKASKVSCEPLVTATFQALFHSSNWSEVARPIRARNCFSDKKAICQRAYCPIIMLLIHSKLRKVAGGVKVFRLAPMRHFATITVIGRDKTGVVARITNFLFLQRANIEALEEQVTRGQFSMTIQTSWKARDLDRDAVRRGLEQIG